ASRYPWLSGFAEEPRGDGPCAGRGVEVSRNEAVETCRVPRDHAVKSRRIPRNHAVKSGGISGNHPVHAIEAGDGAGDRARWKNGRCEVGGVAEAPSVHRITIRVVTPI